MIKIDRNERIRFQKMNSPTIKKSEFSKNETSCTVPPNYSLELTGVFSTSHILLTEVFRTGGKPSTWFPPERLVENTEV